MAVRPIRSTILSGLLLAAVLIPAAASAQPARRPGDERQTVVRLAYVLGQAHALRRLCAGPGDATWYARMQHLLAEEASDDASRRQLVESFNAGFANAQAEYGSCGPRSQAAERGVAEQGRSLALRLAAPE
jgi:uncharacterized protein (TIGR02301 family)